MNGPCIERMLEQYTAIQQAMEQLRGANATAQNLHAFIFEPLNKCYLQFLSFILPLIENINGFFQTEEVIFPEVYNRIETDMIDLLFCFMDEDHVDEVGVAELDFTNDEHLLEHANYRIGDQTRILVEALPEAQQDEFYGVVTNYLFALAREMSVRLETPWRPYKCLQALLPHNALSQKFHDEHPDVMNQIIDLFPRAITGNPQEVEEKIALIRQEWDEMSGADLFNFQIDVRTDSFWDQVKLCRDDENEEEFSFANLGIFVMNILYIGPTTAEVERVFSDERLTKPPRRCRLHFETLRALLQTRYYLRLQGCKDTLKGFVPNERMIELIVARDYSTTNDDGEGIVADLVRELLVPNVVENFIEEEVEE